VCVSPWTQEALQHQCSHAPRPKQDRHPHDTNKAPNPDYPPTLQKGRGHKRQVRKRQVRQKAKKTRTQDSRTQTQQDAQFQMLINIYPDSVTKKDAIISYTLAVSRLALRCAALRCAPLVRRPSSETIISNQHEERKEDPPKESQIGEGCERAGGNVRFGPLVI